MISTRRRFRFLRGTLVAGALYDIGFGVPILFSPGSLAPLLGLALPDHLVYLRLNGIFLLILALFYLAIARDPGRHLPLVPVAIAGRAMGALFFAAHRFGFGAEPVFLLLAAGDLLFAALHAVAMGRRGWASLGGSDGRSV